MAGAGQPMRRPHTTWLVGDIGATNARFGLVAPGGALLHSNTYAYDDFATIDDAIRAFLDTARRPADAAARRAGDRGRDHRRPDPHDQPSLELFGPGVARPARVRAARRDQRFHRAWRWPLPLLGRGGPDAGRRRRAGRRPPIAVLGPGSGLGASGLVPWARRTRLDRADRRGRARDDGAGDRSRERRARSDARAFRPRLGRARACRDRASSISTTALAALDGVPAAPYTRGADHRSGDRRAGPAVPRGDRRCSARCSARWPAISR